MPIYLGKTEHLKEKIHIYQRWCVLQDAEELVGEVLEINGVNCSTRLCDGIYEKYGSISVGKVANAVLFNKKDLSIKHVILKGDTYVR